MGTEYRDSLGVRQLPSVSAEEFWGKRRPCWEFQDINALCTKYRRSNWTALEVLSLDEVSTADRLWVVLHDSLLPSVVMRRFAVEVAAEAMRRADRFDQRSWAALHDSLLPSVEIADAARVAAWAAVAAGTAAGTAQIVMLRQITLRWLAGEDIAAGGPWKRPQSSARSSSDCASSASRIHSENERSSPRAVDA